ncbi:hypothetical protein U5F72_21515, partial [Stenotrophomonas muris]|nr:hypothetical protein [Stenotrophomonas muris]
GSRIGGGCMNELLLNAVDPLHQWLLSPHALLDGAAPAEVLVSDSASVLKAARAEFLADG